MQGQNFICKVCNPTIFNPDFRKKCLYCSNRAYRVVKDADAEKTSFFAPGSVVIDCQATAKNMLGIESEEK